LSENEFQSFAEFWPFYVREHRRATTRRVHFVGTTLAILILLVALALGRWLWLAAVPICGYALAWFSHFVIERNRPATFKYPLWSLRGDLKMWALMATCRMADEAQRILGTDSPS
jgi:hypothetical protein